MRRGLFVTGTDTGVGKTIVAAALARFLRQQGIATGVMKPAESGVSDPSVPGPDAALLRRAAASADTDDEIAPYRFRLPVAPALAAEKERTFIDFSGLVTTAHALADRHGYVIIEGAGGLMTPLTGGLLMADLARATGFPLLIVTTPRLGTLNSTLLTVYAARSMEIPLAGYLVNRMPAAPDVAEADSPHALASLASADLLGVLPEAFGDDDAKVEDLAGFLATMPTLPWLRNALNLPAGR